MTATLTAALGDVHGPADSPERRALTVPRGYTPPTTDIAGLTRRAEQTADATRQPGTPIVVAMAHAIVELGGFTLDDRAYLLGVSVYILETWPRGYWAGEAWAIAARLVR